MKINICKIKNQEHSAMAYIKTNFYGKATFFVYFNDDIFGACVLHTFIKMIEKEFGNECTLTIQGEIDFKNQAILDLIKEETEATTNT